MRIVSIKDDKLQQFAADSEMLQKNNKPCVLILHLKYKGRKHDFAVPLRSNINPSTPKGHYFALPPRKTTKSNYRHGIHYTKMFLVNRSWLLRYRTEGNAEAKRIKEIIDNNEKEIIKSCQSYLESYEKGLRPQFSTDIDLLLSLSDE